LWNLSSPFTEEGKLSAQQLKAFASAVLQDDRLYEKVISLSAESRMEFAGLLAGLARDNGFEVTQDDVRRASVHVRSQITFPHEPLPSADEQVLRWDGLSAY
jgi:hypothetical protein